MSDQHPYSPNSLAIAGQPINSGRFNELAIVTDDNWCGKYPADNQLFGKDLTE